MEMAYFADWAEWWVWFHDDSFRRGWRQESSTVLDHLLSIAVGKESEMSDLYEPAGEHMQEEPADELDCFQ
jgi:hypothetical protein